VILDTSALMAIVLGEDDARPFAEAIRRDRRRAISAATWVEAAIVSERRSAEAAAALDSVLARIVPEIVSVTPDQARVAREAFRRFGRGRHEARLNYGDCFAYALAKERGEPLLFKGDDFGKTDITSALPPTTEGRR